MAHKYLNDIGIKSDDIAVFNTEAIDEKRQWRFVKQRKKYGFDERETWALDFTLMTWLYSHMKAYKKYASKTVDLTFHKFKIPEWDEINHMRSKGIKIVTQDEAIKIIIKNLEFCLKKYENEKYTSECDKRVKYVLEIIGIILPSLWW
jgi:hypothetical protein